MKIKELMAFMKELEKQNVGIVPVSIIFAKFRNEKPASILSEIVRMENGKVVERVAKGLYLNSFTHKSRTALIIELLHVTRPFDQAYLSLEMRAYELSMITQAPNRFTFVTDGRSYTFYTPFGILELVHQNGVNVKSDKDIEFDSERGIYVANKNKVLNDAVRHRRTWLLDLIKEAKYYDRADT